MSTLISGQHLTPTHTLPQPLPSFLGPEKGLKIPMDSGPLTEFDDQQKQKIIGRTKAKNVSDIILGKDSFISER
jgi:hypothetical protein